MDEVPEDRCGYVNHQLVKEDLGSICCWRETYEEFEQCIWHVDTSKKSVDELREARSSHPERLDGAVIHGTHFEGPSFSNCTLVDADISESNFITTAFDSADLRGANMSGVVFEGVSFANAELVGVNFSGADLSGADFSDANAFQANFSEAGLIKAVFHDSNLRQTDFEDATCKQTDFSEADLWDADFEGATLRSAQFLDTIVGRVDFSNVDAWDSNFSNATLLKANFNDATAQLSHFQESELLETDFTDADLEDADLTDANARGATFDDANLEDATFIRTELRDADLRNTRLYQTLFADTRINSNTDFGDTTSYEDPDTELGENYEDTSRWQAAAWVYRRLQDLHEQNAMSERARDYHVAKEEAHRRDYRENGEWFQWGVYTLNRYLTNHGESLKHVAAWSLGIIAACGLLYPFTGGIETANGTNQVAALSDLSLGLVAQSFYYSMVTFTTLGYGNPAGTGAKLLVGLESLAGTLLIALFVFVLGRRVAR